jgi:quinol monooxygenase YgiN
VGADIKVRVKPGKEDELDRIIERLHALEQPDSGLLRSTYMRDQKDPTSIYRMVAFESEEKARAREQAPRRQEGLRDIRADMMEVLDGPQEFVDLEVLREVMP